MNQFVNHSAVAIRAVRLSCVFALMCACGEQGSAATAPPLASAAEAGVPAPSRGGSQASSATTAVGSAGQSGSQLPSAGSAPQANSGSAPTTAPNAGAAVAAAGTGAAAATTEPERGAAFPTEDTIPSDDSFYQPPAPRGQPGDVLRYRESPFTVDLIGQAPEASVMARQVLYRSTDALDEPMVVSGTVLIPSAAWTGPGSRPLVSYAVGTRGLGDACAPSYTLAHGTDYEGSIILSLLERGWAVAVTDYQGSGTPGLHTYMVGRAEGHAVLDMARAAQRLEGTGLSASTPVGLIGYSQGGGSAGWAAQLAPTYAPELNLKGAAIGGVPADLSATAELVDGATFVVFALITALALDAAYPELDLDSYLNDRGRELVAAGEQLCIATLDGFSTLLGETSFTKMDDYVTTNPLKTAPWQARLAENRLGETKPSAPVLQYHGLYDDVVPLAAAEELRRTWCDQGVDLTWETTEIEHVLGIVFGPPYAADWLAERFADQPTASNCEEL